MKKSSFWVTMAAIAALSSTLTGCDNDHWDNGYGWHDPYAWYDNYRGNGWEWNDNSWNNGSHDSQNNTLTDMAQTLCGEWEGLMTYSYINDDNESRTTEKFGTNMKFFQYNNSQNALSGNGVETDYELDSSGYATGTTKTLEFSWYIENNGDIYIKYTQSGATFVMDYGASQIGFHLGTESGKDTDTFYGYMIGTESVVGDVIYINLERINQTSTKAASTRANGSMSFGKGATCKPLEGKTGKLNNRR